MQGKHIARKTRRRSKRDILRYVRILEERVSATEAKNRNLKRQLASIAEENARLRIICEMKGVEAVA